MSKKPRFQTVPGSEGWIVRKVGSQSVNSIHKSQAAAWVEARRLARGSGGEALLTPVDGSAEIRNRYDVHLFGRKVRES